jgi:hypothetical protein
MLLAVAELSLSPTGLAARDRLTAQARTPG